MRASPASKVEKTMFVVRKSIQAPPDDVSGGGEEAAYLEEEDEEARGEEEDVHLDAHREGVGGTA